METLFFSADEEVKLKNGSSFRLDKEEHPFEIVSRIVQICQEREIHDWNLVNVRVQVPTLLGRCARDHYGGIENEALKDE